MTSTLLVSIPTPPRKLSQGDGDMLQTGNLLREPMNVDQASTPPPTWNGRFRRVNTSAQQSGRYLLYKKHAWISMIHDHGLVVLGSPAFSHE